MKQILYIELCNFVDYPLGGHLSFAKHLTTAMHGEIDLAGICTDNINQEGLWSNRNINGYGYNFYCVKSSVVSYKKPIIPARIHSYFAIKKHIAQILSFKDYDMLIVQTPEILISLPKYILPKVVLIMPGCENPMKVSRYKYARLFAKCYDMLFFSFASHVQMILSAADNRAIDEFVLRSRGSVNKNKVFQFPTRYDANVFNVTSKQEMRKVLCIDDDELMIVTTGRLNWFKGWKYMIDAFRIFQEEHTNARLYFLGKGEDEQKINDYILQLGLKNKVVLAGVFPLPMVAKYLNAADLYIMGSYKEGWSTSLVEAIACAKPCVVTEFSSAHDLIKDGENGYVQDKRDENNFSELMNLALKLKQDTLQKFAYEAYRMSVQTMRKQLNNLLHFE